MVTHIAKVWINRVRLSILHVVSCVDKPLELDGAYTGVLSCWGWGWAGDVEVDIIYIPFMMTAQYTGLLGTVQRLTLQQLRIQLNIRARLVKSDRKVLKPFP